LYKIIEYITGYLLNKQFITFSKVEDSFFLYKKLDKKIKLTSEIIKLNYLKESPYQLDESSISSIVSHDNLYLWFHREDGSRYLPEALLIYRKLVKNHNNVLCIVRGEVDKVVVIKEGILVSSFSRKSITKSNTFLIQDEYGIKDILVIEKDKYDSFLKNTYNFLTPNDLFNILNIQIDFKSLINRIIRWSAMPLFISSLLTLMAMGGYGYYLNSEKEKLQEYYQNNKTMTSQIKESIDSNEDENIRFNNLSKEFKYYDKTVAISSIIKVTQEMNLTMHYIKVYENKVDFIVRANEQKAIPLYVKNLFHSEYFVDVKNLSTFKLRNNRLQISMSATLKERGK